MLSETKSTLETIKKHFIRNLHPDLKDGLKVFMSVNLSNFDTYYLNMVVECNKIPTSNSIMVDLKKLNKNDWKTTIEGAAHQISEEIRMYFYSHCPEDEFE